jgi:hypothetical protein
MTSTAPSDATPPGSSIGMDVASIVAGVADFSASPDKGFPFEAVCGISVVDVEGREVPLESLYRPSSASTSASATARAPHRTLLMFGRNLL